MLCGAISGRLAPAFPPRTEDDKPRACGRTAPAGRHLLPRIEPFQCLAAPFPGNSRQPGDCQPLPIAPHSGEPPRGRRSAAHAQRRSVLRPSAVLCSCPGLTPEAPHCGPTPVRTNIAQNLATSKLLFLRAVSQFEFLRGGFRSCEDDAADDGSAETACIRQRAHFDAALGKARTRFHHGHAFLARSLGSSSWWRRVMACRRTWPSDGHGRRREPAAYPSCRR